MRVRFHFLVTAMVLSLLVPFVPVDAIFVEIRVQLVRGELECELGGRVWIS